MGGQRVEGLARPGRLGGNAQAVGTVRDAARRTHGLEEDELDGAILVYLARPRVGVCPRTVCERREKRARAQTTRRRALSCKDPLPSQSPIPSSLRTCGPQSR